MSSSGTITFDQSVLYSTGSGPTHPAISDLDGDGKPDIAIACIFSGIFSVLRNQIVSTGPSCSVPTGETTTNITGTTAKLNWDAVNGATGYAIRYRAVGTNELIRKSATTNSRKLSGLTPNTSYTWQVETFCDVVPPGLHSDWSSQQLFTTGSLKLGDEQPTTFNVYPNPTSGQFKIAITLSDEETSSAIIQVINSLGQIMYNEKTSIANGMLLQEINLKDLPAGMYLVKVIVNDSRQNRDGQVYSAPINFQK
jgi:hypothetical protein